MGVGCEGGSLNDFKFGISIGRFSSDLAASAAVKGLVVFSITSPDSESDLISRDKQEGVCVDKQC